MSTIFNIVTFNENEASAVDLLFDDLVNLSGGLVLRSRRDCIEFPAGATPLYTLRHHALNSQGNVVAATALAQLFFEMAASEWRERSYFIFYGCAGTNDASLKDHVFLVSTVTYASLGTVDLLKKPDRVQPNPCVIPEKVTLKSKWLVHTDPREVDPLPQVGLSLTLGTGAMDLCVSTGIPKARAIATDKVIKVGLCSNPPTPIVPGPPHRVYRKEDWSYRQALDCIQSFADTPLLIDMESYGIGRIATALALQQRTVILRVVTDALADHTGSDTYQRTCLKGARNSIMAVVKALIDQRRGTPNGP
jgi:hypothetical protein